MTLTPQGYLAKARRNLEAAESLAQSGFFEISIARAYYVMFYVASALLLHENMAFKKHSAVMATFSRHFVKTGRVNAQMMDHFADAQDARNEGDYRTAEGYTAEDAARYIGYAKDFIALGEKMLTESLDRPAEADTHEQDE